MFDMGVTFFSLFILNLYVIRDYSEIKPLSKNLEIKGQQVDLDFTEPLIRHMQASKTADISAALIVDQGNKN